MQVWFDHDCPFPGLKTVLADLDLHLLALWKCSLQWRPTEVLPIDLNVTVCRLWVEFDFNISHCGTLRGPLACFATLFKPGLEFVIFAKLIQCLLNDRVGDIAIARAAEL